MEFYEQFNTKFSPSFSICKIFLRNHLSRCYEFFTYINYYCNIDLSLYREILVCEAEMLLMGSFISTVHNNFCVRYFTITVI